MKTHNKNQVQPTCKFLHTVKRAHVSLYYTMDVFVHCEYNLKKIKIKLIENFIYSSYI